MKRFFSLRRCLFNAFAWNDNCDPIEDCYMWAILEGLRRLGTWAAPVNRVTARKDQKCVRNCQIKAGHTYFTDESVIEARHAALPKVCVGCMAMILYFKDVDALPPTLYTHWDMEMKAPVKIDEGSLKER